MLYPLSYEGGAGAKRGRQPPASSSRVFGSIVGVGLAPIPSPWRSNQALGSRPGALKPAGLPWGLSG